MIELRTTNAVLSFLQLAFFGWEEEFVILVFRSKYQMYIKIELHFKPVSFSEVSESRLDFESLPRQIITFGYPNSNVTSKLISIHKSANHFSSFLLISNQPSAVL